MSSTSRSVHPPVPRWRHAAPFLLMAVVAGILVYPLVAGDLLARHGARLVAAVVLAASALSLIAPRGARFTGAGMLPGIAGAALAGAALVSGGRLPLLLVPSWAYLVAAFLFWRSVADGSSLIERFVQRVHPYAPDFIGPYCRKVTLAWGAFFGFHALVLAALALAAPLHWWEGYTAWVVLPLSLVGSLVEYLIRKTWFRYYPYGGPIDRLFSRFFPAEETEMGRRSQAYILSRREAPQ